MRIQVWIDINQTKLLKNCFEDLTFDIATAKDESEIERTRES